MVSTVAPERPLLTVRATAQALGVSEKTVRRLVHSGQLPALRVEDSFASTKTSSGSGFTSSPPVAPRTGVHRQSSRARTVRATERKKHEREPRLGRSGLS
jgi:hypothetical protein